MDSSLKKVGSLIGLIGGVGIAILLTIAGCGDSGGSHNTFHPTARPTPPPSACSGQGLIAIDPVHNAAYAPLHTLDQSGNAQIAVVDLGTVSLTTAATVSTISLTGATNTLASAYNPKNKSVLVETILGAGGIGIFEIDTNTNTVVGGAVTATGLTAEVTRGGILMDLAKNRAFVEGAEEIGILDTSTSPPTWNSGSVVSIVSPDSSAFNLKTNLLFITADGSNQIIDTTKSPLTPVSFDSSFGITDGVAFDITTNIMVLSQEVGADDIYAFNFATLDTKNNPATADNVTVPGIPSELPPVGEGPGGMAVINCNTHQAIVADEGFFSDVGTNIKAIHLPTKPVSGPLNNNGQPGSNTTADAASVYTIATAQLPKGPEGITIGMDGDPNSATIDPAHNFFYALGNQGAYLIRVDVSNPVFGASPTGGVNGTTFWNPPTVYVPLP